MQPQLKTLQIIHLSLCAGLSIAYILIGDLLTLEGFPIPDVDGSSLPFVGIPVLAILLSNFMFKTLLKQVDKQKTVLQNFGLYQTASIIRWAIIEGAAFLILFIKRDFILFGMLLLVYLFFLRPTEGKVKSDLNISDI